MSGQRGSQPERDWGNSNNPLRIAKDPAKAVDNNSVIKIEVYYSYCKNPNAMLNYDLYEILTVYNIGFISVVKYTPFSCNILLVLST